MWGFMLIGLCIMLLLLTFLHLIYSIENDINRKK